jgi:hypothetical protein
MSVHVFMTPSTKSHAVIGIETSLMISATDEMRAMKPEVASRVLLLTALTAPFIPRSNKQRELGVQAMNRDSPSTLHQRVCRFFNDLALE